MEDPVTAIAEDHSGISLIKWVSGLNKHDFLAS